MLFSSMTAFSILQGFEDGLLFHVQNLAIAFVIGGAIGNLIDRAFRGFVVDMFDAYIGQHHWPVFNVADSFICIGMGILVLRMWKGKV